MHVKISVETQPKEAGYLQQVKDNHLSDKSRSIT